MDRDCGVRGIGRGQKWLILVILVLMITSFFACYTIQNDTTWGAWDYVGSHWSIDSALYYGGSKSGKCMTFVADEGWDKRKIGKTVLWGSIKMTGRFRANTIASSTCQVGCYYPISSNGNQIQALTFGKGGHFTYNHKGIKYQNGFSNLGTGQSNFPNDKTYAVDTWYQWEVILDFEKSVQHTKVDGVDLGDIPLRDVFGNTLNSTHRIVSFDFVGSSDGQVAQFNIDDIEVRTYPDLILLFSWDAE